MVPLTLAPDDILLRLGAAALAGAILGINRDLRGKPAGLRTHALVTLGAAVIVIVSSELAHDAGQSDVDAVSRVIQGLITGIGFLGAGVIIHAQGEVRGLTSAATVWVAAMLGAAYGGGHWMSGTAGLALTLITLVFGGSVEGWAHRAFGTDRREGGARRRGTGGHRLED
ncbi:MAG TPA: MgtC/SapB family protein [Gemmatimonadales bacterium]|nr:MgtC/SapB family protein [Gemmatimonadales bacterium]